MGEDEEGEEGKERKKREGEGTGNGVKRYSKDGDVA